VLKPLSSTNLAYVNPDRMIVKVWHCLA